MRAEALERVAPGAGAAGKVTPLTSPAAGKRAAGGGWYGPSAPWNCPAHPLLGWGSGLPGQWDSAVGRELIGFVRISLPKLAHSQTHPAPGKRALLTSPGPALRTSSCPSGREGTVGPLSCPQPTQEPWAQPGALVGGRAQPPHQ